MCLYDLVDFFWEGKPYSSAYYKYEKKNISDEEYDMKKIIIYTKEAHCVFPQNTVFSENSKAFFFEILPSIIYKKIFQKLYISKKC